MVVILSEYMFLILKCRHLHIHIIITNFVWLKSIELRRMNVCGGFSVLVSVETEQSGINERVLLF